MRLHVDLSRTRVSPEVMNMPSERAIEYVNSLFSGNEKMTGWVRWPLDITEEYLSDIKAKADTFASMCDTLIVIGIGGSYLGTYAVLDAVGGPKEGRPSIAFAGQNLSGPYLKKIIDIIRKEDVCLCVVSKSGTTMETSIAFEVLKRELEVKYGESATDRIAAITDPSKGALRSEGNEKGYMMFDIEPDIGGRYSVFTPVGLFPLAVAGIDISMFVKGALEIADKSFFLGDGMKYALTRYALMNRGKEIEIFEYYNPSLHNLGEWVKQLFGESEGKEGRGLFPVSLTFSTDLHSIGQYLQEGKQIFFETVVNVTKYEDDVIIPEGMQQKGLSGRSLNEIAQFAVKGVVAAHSKADIPIVQINLDTNSEYSIGQLMYFFMMSAAITGKLMRIDPFTQDGVEKYKSEIKKLLEEEYIYYRD